MQRLSYPLGEQDFEELRKNGYVYVDKTQYIPKLLRNKYYFLSRPRRFGKSLFLSTLECFFKGKRELFKGLYLESFEWDWSEHPVIRIDLNQGAFTEREGLKKRLSQILDFIEADYEIKNPYGDLTERFGYLIRALSEKFGKGVVILIDEYEKPLLDTIHYPHLDHFRSDLSAFYSVFKNNSRYIRFLFLTGVTRFGHLNIFSELNNLNDISLDNDYAAICGITEAELRTILLPGVKMLAEKKSSTLEETFGKLKEFYDGYHFSSDLIDIYNPYTLLFSLEKLSLKSEWANSGSSAFMIEQIRRSRFDLATLEGITASESELMGTDANMDDIVTLMYQSGYLTIKAFDESREGEDCFTLGVPNREVSKALYSTLIPKFLGQRYKISNGELIQFHNHIMTGEIEKAMVWLKSFFSSIPYDVKLDYENQFQEVIYAFFALVGLMADTTLEKQTSDGRLDMVVATSDYVYIFEFKLGDTAQAAMDQINSKEYGLPWAADNRKIFKIGVSFSPQKRGISDFIIER